MGSVIKAETVGSLGEPRIYAVDPKSIRPRKKIFESSGTLSPVEEARLIVDQAKSQAEEILSAAREECETIRNQAYQEGYEAGLRELEEARSAVGQRFAEIEADVERRVGEFWTAIEPELLSLSVEIAGKIIGREIEKDEEFALNTIKSGLRQLRERRELKIRLNPDDYEFARSRKDEIMSACDGMRSLEFVDDRRVDKGGCLIESPNGNLDARIETQLKEVERSLLEAAHDGKFEAAAETE